MLISAFSLYAQEQIFRVCFLVQVRLIQHLAVRISEQEHLCNIPLFDPLIELFESFTDDVVQFGFLQNILRVVAPVEFHFLGFYGQGSTVPLMDRFDLRAQIVNRWYCFVRSIGRFARGGHDEPRAVYFV